MPLEQPQVGKMSGKGSLAGEFSDVLWKKRGQHCARSPKNRVLWALGGGVVSNMPEEKWGKLWKRRGKWGRENELQCL